MESLQRARVARGSELDELLYHHSRLVIEELIENPQFSERHLLVLLSRRDIPREILAKIAAKREWMNSYNVKLSMIRHPKTPRHVALPLLKFIYLFDLLGLVRSPGLPAELKRVAEDAVVSQRTGLALGQRISLARRGSLRIAAGLLGDRDRRVVEAALENPSLTDQSIAGALLAESDSEHLPDAVMNHSRWSLRHPVKLALVRCQNLSLARLMSILPQLSARDLADLGADHRVALNIRAYAIRTAKARLQRHNR